MHFRLLEAYETAFQDGINPTDAVIAKRLNVRRETVVRWRRRNAPLRAWLCEQIGARGAELRPFVDRRVTQLAISGSAEHTKLFYQFVAKVGTPLDDDGASLNGGSVVVNLLCPRPEQYAAAFNQVAQQPQPIAALPPVPDVHPDVPVVSVRRAR